MNAVSRRSALAGGAAVLAGSSLAHAAHAPVSASDARVQIEGRSAELASGGVRLGFPGVIVRLAVEASRVALRCRATGPDVWVDVRVDGGPRSIRRLVPGGQVLGLYAGVPVPRRIELVRRTESWMGQLDLLGLDVAGSLDAPPPLFPRRLLFVGDSITCGSGDNWPDLAAPEGGVHEDAGASYGALLARRLGAQRHLVAYGGRGVLRDWRGRSDVANAPQFYPRALPDDPASRWEASRYTPDAVGVCLGTNDFSQGVPDREAFVAALVGLLAAIRRDAPRAQILVIDSPMVADDPKRGPLRTLLNAFLDEAVAQTGGAGIERAHLKHYNGRSPKDGHPIGPEHVAIADELEPLFRRALTL